MVSRFFCPEPLPESGEIPLPEPVSHHALRVLRLPDDAPLVLFDGTGREVAARLVVRGKRAFAELGAWSEPVRESPLELVLVQALASADKMDWVMQKAVELGASRIVPVRAARSVLRLSGERAAKRVAHWRQVAVAACEQCGRNRVPEIGDIVDLAVHLSAGRDAVEFVILDPHAGEPLTSLGAPQRARHLLIGPEGGFDELELAACRAAGARALRMGPRVLRTETAGLAVLASMQALWGDL
ncbi:16S rRNA (uracil(1498)-N(3))-methyltransferase [Pseudazoarcus pumilus]|uniref:Ribosomal RNA small subunit methyltransferase E n=1 Tax=Pseudazoarcus pumilus TaxID=2067960 RepID=A0A2I6SAQ0_9RHOO|nr:16S rRNA (uracil(1498)-N(3))-methyltransferase [Pseudazoarcus pumilus]AUN96336.1 16S rRNA (uracil(1498)-N(3))-methyltransferase [Pseudazoarcus pumilus]